MIHTTRAPREPVWSAAPHNLSRRADPGPAATVALRLIKAFHALAFLAISACIALLAWDGLRGRPGRRALFAAVVAVAESAVYGGNNQVCPLTPLAEELGAERRSVTDIYLPRWLSERVPLLGGSAMIAGITLHVVALRRQGSR